MAAIVIAKVEVTDPEKYETYKPLAKKAIDAYGGRYLVRGATPEQLEGPTPDARFVVVEFDSESRAREFYDSELYLEARRARDGAARSEIILLTGV